MQCTDGLLQNFIPETHVILLTNVTLINTIKNTYDVEDEYWTTEYNHLLFFIKLPFPIILIFKCQMPEFQH